MSQPTVIEPTTQTDTFESLLADWRVLPHGYRAVVTLEPSMVMHGKMGVMVSIYFGKDLLTRHLHHPA